MSAPAATHIASDNVYAAAAQMLLDGTLVMLDPEHGLRAVLSMVVFDWSDSDG